MGALNLGALNFGARSPSTFTVVSSPFGLIWRYQFLYYSTIPEGRWSLIAASADVVLAVFLEVEGAYHWLLLFG
jgi:hypothetical protein